MCVCVCVCVFRWGGDAEECVWKAGCGSETYHRQTCVCSRGVLQRKVCIIMCALCVHYVCIIICALCEYYNAHYSHFYPFSLDGWEWLRDAS